MKKFLTVALVGVVASLVIAGPAAAMTKVSINPTKPIVDDWITVSFKVDRNLKPGYHWQVFLLGDSCGYASSLVHKDSTRKPKKGQVMTFRLSPYDDKTYAGGEWCQGKFFVNVMTARDDGRDGGSLVGIGESHFYGKP